jgi:glycogen operon protein
MMLLALLLVVSLSSAAAAAINALNLGARLDGTHSQVTFRVYSSRATRIDLYLALQEGTCDIT